MYVRDLLKNDLTNCFSTNIKKINNVNTLPNTSDSCLYQRIEVLMFLFLSFCV